MRSYKLADPLPMKAVVKGAQGWLLFLVDVPESNCLLEKNDKEFFNFSLLGKRGIFLQFPTFLRWVSRSLHNFDGSFVLTRRVLKLFSPISLEIILEIILVPLIQLSS